ncbi:exodeoxyribonuclease III [Hansschlegelia plantiphila]|uniref:Exodeoxyribonuclease III n=1 Tax=Hansschlegelia plantiphila TaxID=374655 RepID=A0A9W6MW73_9HYPH|nr:exodeoxyribonuclease III [Hansschlegelia plantiphila]GLK68696.1 exodeoxyribonuclease III [Hansschlegelia plantiphila]
MSIRLATWNINSVRLRIGLVAKLVEEHSPDVLCLQETKCADDSFPMGDVRKLGYSHVAIHGQKGYHGVATFSRLPFVTTARERWADKDDARHLATTFAAGPLEGVTLHNFYVPAGGDEPDPAINPKFAHKLQFLDELTSWSTRIADTGGRIMVGDLNIAPHPDDVWSHKQLLKVVSHTPVETEGMEAMRQAGRWVDAVRAHVPYPEKLYSWWSYRAADWTLADRGRRLDHIWASADVAARTTGVAVLREARGWQRPSDHVPVIVTID